MLNEELFKNQESLTAGFLSIISHYSRSFELLEKYDKDELTSGNLNNEVIYIINYKDVKRAIQWLKSDLIKKGEAGELFGNEKDDSFKGIIGSVS